MNLLEKQKSKGQSLIVREEDKKLNSFKQKGEKEFIDWELPTIYPDLNSHQKREVRNQYSREQKGLCYHCKKPLNKDPVEMEQKYHINWDLFPKNFLQHPIHLHHCHDTLLTIGAVHSYCNAVLWQYFGE